MSVGQALASPGGASVSGAGFCQRLCKAVAVDLDRSIGGARRWWSITTDPDFLANQASRRDLWWLLLPLPACLALIDDHHSGAVYQGQLLSLDILTTALLYGTSWLPRGKVWSDLVVSLVHTMYVLVRTWMDAKGIAFQMSFKISQGLSAFGMTAAGIHSVAIGGFLLISTLARGVLDNRIDGFGWDLHQLCFIVYLYFACFMIEKRVASQVNDTITNMYSHKTLNSLSNHHFGETINRNPVSGTSLVYYTDGMTLESGLAGAGLTTPLRTGGPLAEPEDTPCSSRLPAPAASTIPSRSSLADYVLSKMAPSKASRTTSVGDYSFSRLQQSEEDSSRDRAGPCLTGHQMGMPQAASHDVPSFDGLGGSSRALLRSSAAHYFDKGKIAVPGGRSESPLPPMRESREEEQLSETGRQGSRGQREMRLQEVPPMRPVVDRQESELSEHMAPCLPLPLATEDLEAAQNPTEDAQAVQPAQATATLLTTTQGKALVPALGLQALTMPTEARQDTSPPARIPPSPVNSMVSRLSNPNSSVLRAIKLSGFRNQALNDVFVENHDPEVLIGGRETYWSYANEFFLYRSESTNTWGAAKAKRFPQVKEGKGNGVAHSPEGFEIWQQGSALAKKPWREWDTEGKKWMLRTGSGVESRGKVRKKESPPEKGTQTDFQGEDKGVQVSPPASPR